MLFAPIFEMGCRPAPQVCHMTTAPHALSTRRARENGIVEPNGKDPALLASPLTTLSTPLIEVTEPNSMGE